MNVPICFDFEWLLAPFRRHCRNARKRARRERRGK